jgi:hypothetical protein
MKKFYEYDLVGPDEVAPRKYYFRDNVAEEHNRQFTHSKTPRRLVKVKGGRVVEKPSWWSGKITDGR